LDIAPPVPIFGTTDRRFASMKTYTKDPEAIAA
jgi:hypothetical protein